MTFSIVARSADGESDGERHKRQREPRFQDPISIGDHPKQERKAENGKLMEFSPGAVSSGDVETDCKDEEAAEAAKNPE